MGKSGACSREDLLRRWRAIEEEYEDSDDDEERLLPSNQTDSRRFKEEWFADAFKYLTRLPAEMHLWCGSWDLMGPLLEAFHSYYQDQSSDSPVRLIWERVSREMGYCTQCVCQYHHAQDTYDSEYEHETVGPLLQVLRTLDAERVTARLKEMNSKIAVKDYDPESHSPEVVCIMFEVLTFPMLLDSQSLVDEFTSFVEVIDSSHEVSLAGNQTYPGVYALLFLKNAKARAVGLRLAGSMGKLRTALDLEPLQPLLRKYIDILEVEVLPSNFDLSRPKVQHERITIWLGLKALLGFLEPSAFEEGILERYPIILSIVLNHVSDDTPEFSYAVTCLRLFFEMLGCKLWLRTTLSPNVMRNTLLGQCFHTRNEKSHKEIFDLFLPFLQSLEALQDGEHEKQRRHFLYFLLHQVPQSSNFSFLMRKTACKIALFIVQRGYTMNPPCPPFECAHMWGPSLLSSLKDSTLHSSLRQPAIDLIQIIIVSDCAALISLNWSTRDSVDGMESDSCNDENEFLFSSDVITAENSCWKAFNYREKIVVTACSDWKCIPMLWLQVLVEMDQSVLPITFGKAVFWALSHLSMLETDIRFENNMSTNDWLSSYAKEVLHSFGWEIPKGYDDGGDGKGTKNTVSVVSFCISLRRTFKRFAAHFIVTMEQYGLHKQWCWEPGMAESLILLLIDSDDTVRQVNRIILEHVSKTKGLTSGLQFLCSSVSSLSSLYVGLKHAIKQVQLDSCLVSFRHLHHLFFVVKKLLSEVVPSSERPSINPELDAGHVRLSSEGGFLRKPGADQLKICALTSATTLMDVKSWNRFNHLLSSLVWPCILRILTRGEIFIDNKNCQMTCIRLLEILPVIFEKILSSPFQMSHGVELTLEDLKWLFDLVEWGKSSLVVVNRHWKQSVLSLVNSLETCCTSNIQCTISSIKNIISKDTTSIDELRECISNVSLSKGTLYSTHRKSKQAEFQCPHPSQKNLAANLAYFENKISGRGDMMPLPENTVKDSIILISDDEGEHLPPLALSSSSCHLSGNVQRESLSNKAITPENDKSLDKLPNSTVFSAEYSATNAVAQTNSMFSKQDVSTTLASTDISPESVVNSNCNTPKEVRRMPKERPLKAESVINAEGNLIKKVLCEEVEDPLEVALNSACRLHGILNKPSVAVPKRKVIQLQMPMDDKRFSHRLDSGVRRLKPARMDDWYRPVLELNYYCVVGLSTDVKENTPVTPNLKNVPLCFISPEHYMNIFRPLVLEEFKAQLHNSYLEASAVDEMSCCSLCVLSVERIDDFHLVRASLEGNKSYSTRDLSENDLILLTKEPVQVTVQPVHALGKVERIEKHNKTRSPILSIRFYLQNAQARLSRIKRLLIERSKWHITPVMNMTPQLREFQALSSLMDIPLIPIILNPVDSSYKNLGKPNLSRLSQPMQKALESSFNCSQLQAISEATRNKTPNKAYDLALIQGPPGTGKTRTIVAIVSALLSLGSGNATDSKLQDKTLSSDGTAFAQYKARVCQAAAIARAWQDAAVAKQMIQDKVGDNSSSSIPSSRGRILICAQSNAAVDELVSRINKGLYGKDGKMYKPYLVRVGNVKTVHPSSLPFFIDTLVEQRLSGMKNETDVKKDKSVDSSVSLRAKLERIVDNIRVFESLRSKQRDQETETKDNSGHNTSAEDDRKGLSDEEIGFKLNNLYSQKKVVCGEIAAAQIRERKTFEESKFLKMKIRKSIIREAEIVVTTLSGCGGDIYSICSDYASNPKFAGNSERFLFDAVVIDEAAQALEPATLIPLQLLKSNGTKCIMVGDPKQLPATVLSSTASKFLYECSMFERLQRAGHPVVMLTEQYRMHPEISKFPSSHFYENKLLNGTEMESKFAPFHENACLGPYVFYDVCNGLEHRGRSSGSLSLYNEAEAEAAVELLKLLRKRHTSEFIPGRLGLITPYKCQLSVLRSKVNNEFGPSIASDIEFNTVDGFQGREVDILILSTVRAAEPTDQEHYKNISSIGFVADVRRMNVALTRARLSLWILGNARTLQKNCHWADLIANAKERNVFFPLPKPFKSNFQKLSSHTNTNEISNLSSRLILERRPKGVISCDFRVAEGVKIKRTRQEMEKYRGGMQFDDVHKHKFSSSDIVLSGQERKESLSSLKKGKRVGAPENAIAKPNAFLKKNDIVKSSKVKSNHKMMESPANNVSVRHSPQTSLVPNCINDAHDKETHCSQVKSSTAVSAPQDLISTRKRQRDDVDALLSSSLISSKRTDAAYKPAPARSSLSTSTSERATIRPAKPRKDCF